MTIQIRTTVPISMSDIKRKFTEDVEFIIECSASKFKGKVLLTYLSNLEIKCRLELTDLEESLDLVVAYLNSPMMVSQSDLEDVVINLLLALQDKPNFSAVSGELLSSFAEANRSILEVWFTRIAAIPLYGIYCMGDRADELDADQEVNTTILRTSQTYVESFPIDDNESLVGINYVNLIKHPMFALLLEGVSERNYTYNEALFNEPRIFSGKNLFHYFAHPNNPIFVSLIASLTKEDSVEYNRLLNAVNDELNQTLKELGNVSLI